jgi:hypothetical protein
MRVVGQRHQAMAATNNGCPSGDQARLPVIFTPTGVHWTDGMKPGQYSKSRAPTRAHGWAIVCCPTCGKLSTVGINHEVSAAGVVHPSYVCPFPPCTFHLFISLAHW